MLYKKFFSILILSFYSLPCFATGVILVLGDSLSAGYGMQPQQGWVGLMAAQIAANNLDYNVTNASLSGLTTAGGLDMLPDLLANNKPNIFILALGCNDALRGLPLFIMVNNLAKMIELAQASNATVLLVGFELPPTMGGEQYTEEFNADFPKLAQKYTVAFVPFLMQGFAGDVSYFEEDQLHPNEKAQPIMMNNVWQYLQPLLAPINSSATP